LRAPEGDGEILAEPPLPETGRLIAANRSALNTSGIAILGRPLTELRAAARRSAVAAAEAYHREAGEPVGRSDSSSLLLAGHQPDLFHPGVWVKNFALGALARAHGATPLNLIVDNDTMKAAAVRVPAWDAAIDPRVETPAPGQSSGTRVRQPALVPFDRWTGERPYEERKVIDEGLFASFPRRVAAGLDGWGLKPIVQVFWAEVDRHAARTSLVGERFAAGRRALERSWGCHNLELPVSRLCATEPYAWFACHLLGDLPRFHAAHNECLRAYRASHGLRNHAHPVPDLAAEGDWLEAPLWAWRAGRSAAPRGRLMVRRNADRAELRVGDEAWPSVPLGPCPACNAAPAVAAWQGLEREGYKVRSRALTNTLFARLFLGDLFVHGIGGATYDELTDMIVRRFYGLEPPGFLILSGTLRLPLPSFRTTESECRQWARLERDLQCNPQRHLSATDDPEALELARCKQEWIDRSVRARRERSERWRKLRQLTDQLAGYVTPRQEQARSMLGRCEYQQHVNALLRRRDYALCLFPEPLLRGFCTQFGDLPPACL
jgi:hypothetical protein